MNLSRFPLYVFFLSALFLSSCVDDEFDSPPIDGVEPDITVTSTIRDVKNLHTLGGLEEIKEDIIISGIVTADDRTGNFYKTLVIQDSTAAIELRLNETDLFNEYGLGRRLYIKCKGMWLGDYNGVTQLGGGTELGDRGSLELTQVPSALFDDFIVKGTWNHTVEPVVKTIAQLRQSDVSMLVKLENMQFSLETCERTYARDYISAGGTRVQESLNQNMESCTNGAVVLLRSSGFCNFATQALPTGSGSVTAIYTVFGTTKQLVIRNTADVDMNEARCGDAGVNGALKTIKEVRDMYTGSAINLSGDFKISGTVISDVLNSNTTNRNLVIQDGDAGIVVRFEESHGFGLGEIMEINIKDVELSDFNGLLQLNNVPISNAFSTCNIGEVIPRETTVQEIINNADLWESTLIKVKAVTLSGGSTFSGGTFVTDATGTINMFTQSFATFAGTFLPIGEVDLTAMVGDFNGVQLNMRNIDDVEGGQDVGDPDDVTLAEIRALYTGATINIPNNFQVKGVVISDGEAGNIHAQNIFLQDGTAGIVVRFSEAHPFVLGQELTITVRGVELSEFRTLLQLNGVALSNVTDEKAGVLPSPRIATVADIKTNGEAWESTLVTVQNATISGSTTFNGVTKIGDASGEIDMFTSSAAVFSGNSLPSGAVSVTGVITEFDGTRQISMRNASDVQ
jgi:DNA/RNA endonuclease YhcR with UshA esterase domain